MSKTPPQKGICYKTAYSWRDLGIIEYSFIVIIQISSA